MEWAKLFSADRRPAEVEVDAFVGSPLWAEINRYLREAYGAEPRWSYSACSGQPGWNVKYSKGGRSLCTLYPMPGFFIALVVIGAREQDEAGLIIPACSAQVRHLYNSAVSISGGRWLMISVTGEDILTDVKRLVAARRKPKTEVHRCQGQPPGRN